MKKVLILKGLPASGKTTWAKELIAKEPGRWKRVNKDDLRSMLDGGKWSSSNEKLVIRLRDDIIIKALEDGKNVLVDDTNLHPKHEARIREITKGLATVQEKNFGYSPEVCIERDLKRPNSVGSKVIWDMYNKFIKPESETYTPPEGKPKAIIVDIDGTVALMNGKRGPYDWDKVGLDDVNWPIWRLINNYINNGDTKIILVSGRDGSSEVETRLWLVNNNIRFNKLYLRPAGDNRKDSIIKREIFDNHIREDYDVQFVLDDRNQTVAMWRLLGLTCLQVADGNF